MKLRTALTLALAALPAARAGAQEPGFSTSGQGELAVFELDAALTKETTIASRRPRTARETPGIVTIVTREDMLASGARDLSEVLLRVPGFQLGGDVESDVGVGFRGVWGNEGKVLFLLDGIEMNDLSYGNFPLGNHLLVDDLESVEIIRGPGSALYGGHAELAVVSVTTRAAAVRGVSAIVTAGTMERALRLVDGALAAGLERGGVSAGLAVAGGVGNRSDRTYTDVYGASYDMATASSTDPLTVTGAIGWKGLTLRALYDDYRTIMRDGYDTIAPTKVPVRWRTAAADVAWKIPIGERFTITPELVYRHEVPWQSTDAALPTYYYDVTNQRLTGRVVATLDPHPAVNVVAGVEAYAENARVNDPSNGILSFQGGTSDHVSYRNLALFAEAGVDTPWVNVLAGVRYEASSAFGSSFVPRLALTKLFGAFHAKLLANGAFRVPSIENINYGIDIQPERTWDFEAEVGWQATDAIYLAANVYDLTLDRPIVFGYDIATGVEAYRNDQPTGSRGAEAELRVRTPWGPVQASWSYYTSRSKNEVQTYVVPDHPDVVLGFAANKVVASAQLRFLGHLLVSPTFVYLSDRWGYAGVDGTGQPVVSNLGSRTWFDLFLAWRDLGVRGLELGAGVKNAFQDRFEYVQPYAGGHAPLPGPSREVFVRLRFDRAG